MQSPSETVESTVCPFLMTSIVGGHGCLARSNDAIMISPRYVTACCLTGEHAGCSLYRNGDPVALARVREYRYQQSKKLVDEHRKAKNLPDETQQVAADSSPEERTPMTSDEPGAGTPNGHRSESKMSLLDMLRAPTMQELEEGPGSMRPPGGRVETPAPVSGADERPPPPSEGSRNVLGPEQELENAAQPPTEAEPASGPEPEVNRSAHTPPEPSTLSDEIEPPTLEPSQPSRYEPSGVTPDLRAPAEMELFAEIVTVEPEQQWATLEPLTYEVETAPAPMVRPVDASAPARPAEPLSSDPPSHEEVDGAGSLDAEQPGATAAFADGPVPTRQTIEPALDVDEEQQEPPAAKPVSAVDESPSSEVAQTQDTSTAPLDDPVPPPDTTYSWQPGTVEEIRPARAQSAADEMRPSREPSESDEARAPREPRVAETHSYSMPAYGSPAQTGMPTMDEELAVRRARAAVRVPQPHKWTAGLKGWTRRKIALVALILVLGSGDVITLVPRLTRTQNAPAAARSWQFPEVLGSADQVLLMFSNPNRSAITVQVHMTSSTGAAEKRIRVPTGTETELALSPGTATDSIAVSSPAPFLVQRMVVQNNRVQSTYGLPAGTSGKANRPKP